MKIPLLSLVFIKVKLEQFFQDFDVILLKVSNILSQFLLFKIRLFTSKTYTKFVTMVSFT